MFSMSLLNYTSIIEYVDLFEDEEDTKVATLCIDGDNLESIPRKSPWTERGNFSITTMYSACNWY